MKTIWTITKRELYAYFTSPVAYVFLVIFLLLTGFFTFTAGNFFERGEASLASFFGWHPRLYLVLVPAGRLGGLGEGGGPRKIQGSSNHPGAAPAGVVPQVPPNLVFP